MMPDGQNSAIGGSGNCIVFATALPSHAAQVWEHQIGLFGQSFQVICVSALDNITSLSDIVANCATERLALVGHGEAGSVCIAFAASAPNRVATLILVAVPEIEVEAVEALDCPVAFFVGLNDDAAVIDKIRKDQARVDGSFLVEFATAGNVIFQDSATEFNDSVLSILQMADFSAGGNLPHSNAAGYSPVE